MVTIAPTQDKPFEDKALGSVKQQSSKRTARLESKEAYARFRETDLIRKAYFLAVATLGGIALIWLLYFFFGTTSELTSYVVTALFSIVTFILGFLFGANRK